MLGSGIMSGCWSGRLDGETLGVFCFFPNESDLKNPLRELPDSVESEVVDWLKVELGA